MFQIIACMFANQVKKGLKACFKKKDTVSDCECVPLSHFINFVLICTVFKEQMLQPHTRTPAAIATTEYVHAY